MALWMVAGRVLSLGRNLSSAALTLLVRVARNCCKSNRVFADMTVCFRKRPQPAQVLRGFYLRRWFVSAGEINGDGHRPPLQPDNARFRSSGRGHIAFQNHEKIAALAGSAFHSNVSAM